jgi:hypothetical protein
MSESFIDHQYGIGGLPERQTADVRYPIGRPRAGDKAGSIGP